MCEFSESDSTLLLFSLCLNSCFTGGLSAIIGYPTMYSSVMLEYSDFNWYLNM